MTDTQVFVYRHLNTGKVFASFAADAHKFENERFEHVNTLHPLLWIEYNYDSINLLNDFLEALDGRT